MDKEVDSVENRLDIAASKQAGTEKRSGYQTKELGINEWVTHVEENAKHGKISHEVTDDISGGKRFRRHIIYETFPQSIIYNEVTGQKTYRSGSSLTVYWEAVSSSDSATHKDPT